MLLDTVCCIYQKDANPTTDRHETQKTPRRERPAPKLTLLHSALKKKDPAKSTVAAELIQVLDKLERST